MGVIDKHRHYIYTRSDVIYITCTFTCADTGAGSGGQHSHKAKAKGLAPPKHGPTNAGARSTRLCTQQQLQTSTQSPTCATSPRRPRSTLRAHRNGGAAVSGARHPRPARLPSPAQPSNKPPCRAPPPPHPSPTCWAGKGATRGAGLCVARGRGAGVCWRRVWVGVEVGRWGWGCAGIPARTGG